MVGCSGAVCAPVLHPGVACRETYRGRKAQVEEIHDKEEEGEGPGGEEPSGDAHARFLGDTLYDTLPYLIVPRTDKM